MGDAHEAASRPEPETLCTRVVARVIEELSCIEIAPDSPTWSDLCAGGARVGQLAVYRGRSGVRRMVSFDVRAPVPGLDLHFVAVLTEPGSFVPHLLVSAWANGPQVHVHADLLPRAPLADCSAYADCCYATLRAARERAHRDPRLTPQVPSEALRTWGSPWAFACQATPAALRPVAECVEAYTNQWARLMRQGTPYAAQCDAEAALEGQRHDGAQLGNVFQRNADPLWAQLEPVVGAQAVDMLLAALRGQD